MAPIRQSHEERLVLGSVETRPDPIVIRSLARQIVLFLVSRVVVRPRFTAESSIHQTFFFLLLRSAARLLPFSNDSPEPLSLEFVPLALFPPTFLKLAPPGFPSILSRTSRLPSCFCDSRGHISL
jgi:hypothetical protein